MELVTDAAKRIIVALDVATKEKALRLVHELPEVQWFKIGLELFTACGPSLIEEVRHLGHQVFLDLKLHDIPNTVAGAVRAAVRHGVSMLTLHASGGKEMLRWAADTAKEESSRLQTSFPQLVAVTILTSLNDQQIKEIGWKEGVEAQVLRLSLLARESGLDGTVCSAREISLLREEMGRDWLLVTPGIRPTWAAAQDQQRILTPEEAISLGADYLVIGRPITAAASPRQAFQRIVEEIEASSHASDRKNS